MFAVLDDEGLDVEIVQGQAFTLTALYSIVIPALCLGSIPHGLTVVKTETAGIEGSLWMVREPGAMDRLNLIVDQGPIGLGSVRTTVFNLSNAQIKIKKGDCISRLVRRGITWEM